ncbi:hypothetical protein H5410_031028, partial [Solanum commersonii]
MSTLVDIVEIQSWTHLFMTKSPILYDEQVREFYYTMELTEDGSLNTLIQLKHELEELIVFVIKNDAEITLLKPQLAKAHIEGPSTTEVQELRMKNASRLAQNVDLQMKLIKAHDTANDRLTL